MTDTVILEIIKTVGIIGTGVMTYFINKRVNRVDHKVNDVKETQVKAHNEINGRMTELLAANKIASHAEGKAEGESIQTAGLAAQKEQIDSSTQRIIDEVIEAVKEAKQLGKPIKVVIEENQDKEVIIKKNLDK